MFPEYTTHKDEKNKMWVIYFRDNKAIMNQLRKIKK